MLGLCGGYQMLGRSIADPDGIEGPAGTVPGLGLLDVETVLSGEKRLAAVSGETTDGIAFSGYEMHMGVTEGQGRARLCRIGGAPEGAVSADGRIIGTYAHGLFTDDRQRTAWPERLGAGPAQVPYEDGVEATLDALAAHLEAAHRPRPPAGTGGAGQRMRAILPVEPPIGRLLFGENFQLVLFRGSSWLTTNDSLIRGNVRWWN